VNPGIAVTITNLTLRGTAGSAHVGLLNLGQANLTAVRVTNCGTDGISQFGVMSLDSCKIDLNGRDRPFLGGGMNIQGDSTIVDRTSITDNKAARGGGICLMNPGVGLILSIRRSLIANNTASENGGGVYAEGEMEMKNTTVTGNSAASHGGGFRMESTGDELHIQQCTIARNTASTGGGLSINSAGVSTPAIAFNIFANNTATSNMAPDVEWAPHSLSQNYNLIRNPSGWVSSVFPSSAGNKIGADPGLGALQNLGGPTSVLPITTGSPAFNAIPTGFPLAPEDQRGFPRPRRGAYDMGAFEVQ
jgi:predicted outer membrane repeat protein